MLANPGPHALKPQQIPTLGEVAAEGRPLPGSRVAVRTVPGAHPRKPSVGERRSTRPETPADPNTRGEGGGLGGVGRVGRGVGGVRVSWRTDHSMSTTRASAGKRRYQYQRPAKERARFKVRLVARLIRMQI